MNYHRIKQVLYILVATFILYILYQLISFKNTRTDETKPGDKVKLLLYLLISNSIIVFYFNIGIDELQYGGEQRLHDVLQFEKSMINNINQDVEIGKVPF